MCLLEIILVKDCNGDNFVAHSALEFESLYVTTEDAFVCHDVVLLE